MGCVQPYGAGCGTCSPSGNGSYCESSAFPSGHSNIGCADGYVCAFLDEPSENDRTGICSRYGSPCASAADCGEPVGPFGQLACDQGVCDLASGAATCGTWLGPVPPCAGGWYCVSGLCEPQVPVGGACSSNDDGKCATGLCCVTEDQSGNCPPGSVCQAPGGVGSGCLDPVWCDASSWCENGVCAPRLTEGWACDFDLQNCAAGLACDPTSNTCVPPHPIPIGGACTVYYLADVAFPCAPGAVCANLQGGTYVCIATAGPSGPCQRDIQCPVGYACSSGGVCEPATALCN
jgi:hypothetical protein